MSDSPAPVAPAPDAPAQTEQAKPDASGAPVKAAAPAPVSRKVKLALDGDTEQEFDLDQVKAWVSRGKNAAQLMSKAEQRAREAADAEKRAGTVKERLGNKAEREKLLKEWNIDPRQFAEELLLPYVQNEMLSEEQRALQSERQRAEAAEARLKEREAADLTAKEAAEIEQHKQRLGSSFVKALDALKVPQSVWPFAVRRMAAFQEHAEEDVPPEELAEIVKADALAEFRSYADGMTAEQLEEWLGQGPRLKLRQFDLAKLKARQAGLPGAHVAQHVNGQPSTNGASKRKAFMTDREWEAELKRRTSEG